MGTRPKINELRMISERFLGAIAGEVKRYCNQIIQLLQNVIIEVICYHLNIPAYQYVNPITVQRLFRSGMIYVIGRR